MFKIKIKFELWEVLIYFRFFKKVNIYFFIKIKMWIEVWLMIGVSLKEWILVDKEILNIWGCVWIIFKVKNECI